MIPILYEGNETQFTTNGLGRLADAISCKVVEERNATYELEMTYPVSGVHYDDLAENRIILAQPFDGGQTQPFIIYKITKPLNGIVTVNAEHISYRLSGYTVMPFTANSCMSALAGIDSNSAVENPFTFTTDKTTTGNFTVTVPTNARELLCGSQGSVLDVYGKGDYEFNRFNVKLWQNRGADNHVTLRYGKNITELKSVIDLTGVYTGIVPYWTDGAGQVTTLTEKVVMSEHASEFPYMIIKPVDFTQRWDNQPTEAQLRAAAQSYVTSNEGWKVKNNITVSFVALWNTEEYKDIAPLERVKMCDAVHVVYPKLGVNFTTKVIKTDYNVLLERYNDIVLGDTYYSLSQVFNEEIQNSQQEQMTYFQKAIAHGTALITGGLGGYVYLKPNADGQPEEILIMDKMDYTQAVRMIRMNKNGIGFSDNGYNGPFHTAWTIEQNTGHFYAEYIDAGTFNANLIQAGRIQPIINGVASANYWDMLTGEFHLSPTVQVGNSTIASKEDITDYDTNLNQQKVFNKLTNNGTTQGITLVDGNLYINASIIKSGALIVGGTAGMVGEITVKGSDNNTVIGKWNKDGIDVKSGSIKGASVTVGGNNNSDGYLRVNNSVGGEIGRWDVNGIDVKSGSIKGASVTVGGNNNANGYVSVLNSSNTEVARLDNSGIDVKAGSIKGASVTVGGNNNSDGYLRVNNSVGGEIGRWDVNGIDVKSGSIKGASVTVGGNNNANGYVSVLNSSNTEVARLDNSGIDVKAGSIKGASLTVGGYNNDDGYIIVNNSAGTEIGRWDANGIDIKEGSIKGASLTVGGNNNDDGYIKVNNSAGTEIGRWDANGLDVKSGTITGATIRTAANGERIEMNTTSSIMGYNASGLHNLLNMMQTGSTQMTLDSDTRLNIRTPEIGVLNESHGTGSATVNVTLTDSLTDYTDQAMDTGRNCWRICDVRKYMLPDPQTGPGEPYEMHEIYLHDETRDGNWQVFCTLPVFLKFRYKNERRMLGMVLSQRTADSFVV